MARFNPFSKHDWKHAADKAGDAAKHAAEEAKKKAEQEAAALAKEVEKEIMTSINDIKNLANGLKQDIEKAGQSAVHSVEDAEQKGIHALADKGQECEHGLANFGQKCESDLKQTLDESGDGWKKLLDETGDSVKADIEKIAKSQAAELTAEALEKGLKEAHKVAVAAETFIERMEDKAPTIVDMLNSQSLPINLGPLVLTYANGVKRIKELADALGKVSGQDFKLTQTFINDLLHGLGPDTISIHADVEFFVEVGIDLNDIPFAAFVEVADLVFDAVGVPKD